MKTISFSQYDNYNSCPERYRQTYLVPQDKQQDLVNPDCKHAAIGTYIQHLFDNLISKHFYNPDYSLDPRLFSNSGQIYKELHYLVYKEVISTDDDFMTRPPEPITLEYLTETNKTFTVDHNKNSLMSLNQVRQHILEESICLFLKNWNYLFYSTPLRKLGITPENCKTEVKVEKQTPNFNFIGFVDFLFDTDNGHIILDGKLNKNLLYAQPTQLEFYAWALGINDHDTKVGFINYTMSKTKLWDISPRDIYRVLDDFTSEISELDPEQQWRLSPSQRGQVKGHCKWCRIQNLCPATKAHTTTHKQSFDNLDDTDFSISLSEFKR